MVSDDTKITYVQALGYKLGSTLNIIGAGIWLIAATLNQSQVMIYLACIFTGIILLLSAISNLRRASKVVKELHLCS